MCLHNRGGGLCLRYFLEKWIIFAACFRDSILLFNGMGKSG